ncbi:TPM domain-containing protein [Marinoscillum sp. MHG1-6]|uniref:TPM domain-containing protein n=1 Tax=Marinoscillum sp. MHG1-6 TaxID=2959627 RepID=UPI0021571F4A|nr:TPM domain-containing protein [Marinoscillum sp. MHG1-6]
MAKYTFTSGEKEQVKQAVKDLEKVSCGEIVPYFVNSSDDYSEATWYSSASLGAISTIVMGLLSYTWMLPFHLTPLEVSIVILISLIIGFLVPVVLPQSRRLIISRDKQEQRVRQRAAEAFLTEKVYQTEEKVGILIFVSQLEHQVLVIGDEGINEKVKPGDWEEVVNLIIEGIKSGQTSVGLIKAINQCKDLLLANGFVRKSTDFNELDDDLRIED